MARNSRTALVTGAYGFTGRHLARRLLAAGWRVHGLCRPSSRAKAAEFPEIEARFGDLATGEGLDDAPRGVEAVFHAGSVVATSSRDEARAVIVEGTRRLAQAAARQGVKRFVQIGSTAVYGHGALMDADEETPRRPEDPYGEGKARAEDLLLKMQARGDLEVVLLRPRLIYGPGDNHFMPTVREALAKGKVILVNGGRAVNDIVHVDDLVAACVLVVDSDRAKGRAYNITSGESITSKAFFETVADRFELPRPTRALPYSAAWAIASAMTFAQSLRGHTTSYSPLKRLRLFGLPHHFSIERATDELGFGPEKRLQEALQCL